MSKRVHYKLKAKGIDPIYLPYTLYRKLLHTFNPKNFKVDLYGDRVHLFKSNFCRHDCNTCALSSGGYSGCTELLELLYPNTESMIVAGHKLDVVDHYHPNRWPTIKRIYKKLLSLKKCYR